MEHKRKLQPHEAKRNVSKMIPSILMMIGIQHACYLALRMAFARGWTGIIGLTPMTNDTCETQQDNEKCGRDDLFAFQFVSGMVFLVCGGYGFFVWHVDRSLPKKTVADRLFGYHPLAEEITKLNFAYQIWDILISLTIPENCEWVMMTHHTVAAFLAWSGLSNGMMGYYATFFLGISEVSSIFLVLLDCSKYYEPSTFGFPMVQMLALLSGAVFVVTFACYRVFLWWPTSIRLFRDVSEATSGTPSQMRALRTWLVFNVPMGFLQLYWLGVILGEVKAVVS